MSLIAKVGHGLRVAWATARKEFTVLIRYPTWIAGLLLWPVIFPASYVFLARAMSGPGNEAMAAFGHRAGTEDYVGYIIFGTTMWMLLNSVLWTLGSHLRQEQVRGTLEATWTAPASRVGMLLGTAGLQLVQAATTVAVSLLMVKLVWGFELVGSLSLLAGLVLLSLVPVIGLGILFASFVVYFKEVNAMVFLVRGVFMVFAGMTYPVEVLPPWMQKVSELLPLTYSIRALRAVGLSGADRAAVQSDAAALVVFSFVFLALGLGAFRVVERAARRAGSLAHY